MLTVVAPGDSFQFLHESRRNQHQFTLKLHVIWAKGEKRKREEEKGGYVCMDTSCTPGEGGGECSQCLLWGGRKCQLLLCDLDVSIFLAK